MNKTRRAAERTETFELGKQAVRVSLCQNLHFKNLADWIDSLVQVDAAMCVGVLAIAVSA